jgi:hypothetical protein
VHSGRIELPTNFPMNLKQNQNEEFDSIITDSTIPTMQITSSDEWDSLEGVPLLDALIDKFSDDAEKSQTLSKLTQSLVLQIRHQHLWIEVTTIVRRHVDCVDDLIQSLKYINQDIEWRNCLCSTRKNNA